MTASTPVPGMLPAGYQFQSILGRGSSGWVALARDESLGRDVAVKTVLVGGDAGAAVRRLEREARVLAGLNHRGIVRVHRLIPAPAAVFLVMDFLPGRTLAKACTDLDFPVDQRMRALKEVSAALQAVHDNGIAHRDVKPSNVVLHPDRGAVLVDFGLARLPPARAAFRSAAGLATGTPLYMAPEQITTPGAATPAMDAYAFGVMTYVVLLGRHPYPSATLADVLESHRSGRLIDPRVRHPTLPAAAAAILIRAMDRDPRHRPTPAELMRQLERVPERCWHADERSGTEQVVAPAGVRSPEPAGTAAHEVAESDVGGPPTGQNPMVWSELDATGRAPQDLYSTAEPLNVDERRQTSTVADDAAPDEWVQASVYRPPRRPRAVRSVRRAAVVGLAALAGLLTGLLAVAAWLLSHR